MKTEFTIHAWDDFSYWINNDDAVVFKIKALIAAIRIVPFKGIGKPEPSKYDLKGFWSRRIIGEQRLVYCVTGSKGKDQKCTIIQCRFHYDDK